MARRKAERPAERGVRRAETNAVATYLTALRAPKVPARSRAKLEQRRAQAKLAQLCHLGRVRNIAIESRPYGALSAPARTMVQTAGHEEVPLR
jgi:hypothetical protein